MSDEGFPYRYVTAEGPVEIEDLGERTFAAIEAMAARYFGAEGGRRYAQTAYTPRMGRKVHVRTGLSHAPAPPPRSSRLPIRWRS